MLGVGEGPLPRGLLCGVAMTGLRTMGRGGDGNEGWDTATMAEEDKIMEQAVELMKLHHVPSDFRQFVSDCYHFGGGAVEGQGLYASGFQKHYSREAQQKHYSCRAQNNFFDV